MTEGLYARWQLGHLQYSFYLAQTRPEVFSSFSASPSELTDGFANFLRAPCQVLPKAVVAMVNEVL